MSVYRIKSPHSDKVYIGGTFQPLNKRFSEHKSQYKRWLRGDSKALYYSSYEILKLGDAYIERVDTHDCLTVGELCDHEAHYQQDTNCINKLQKHMSATKKINAIPRESNHTPQRRGSKGKGQNMLRLYSCRDL